MPKNIKARKKGSQLGYIKKREYIRDMSSILYEKIFNELKKGEFDIVISTHTSGEAGFTDYENNAIFLNPNEYPIEETLIHEVMHILKPDSDESTIIEMSSLLYEKLTPIRKNKLMQYINTLTTRRVGIKKYQLHKIMMTSV